MTAKKLCVFGYQLITTDFTIWNKYYFANIQDLRQTLDLKYGSCEQFRKLSFNTCLFLQGGKRSQSSFLHHPLHLKRRTIKIFPLTTQQRKEEAFLLYYFRARLFAQDFFPRIFFQEKTKAKNGQLGLSLRVS